MREIRFPLPPASERSKRPHNHLTAGGALRIPASPLTAMKIRHMGWIKMAIPSFPPYEKCGSPVPHFIDAPANPHSTLERSHSTTAAMTT